MLGEARRIATYCITTPWPSRGPCGGDGWENGTCIAVEEAKEEAEEAGRRRPRHYVDLAVDWRMGSDGAGVK